MRKVTPLLGIAVMLIAALLIGAVALAAEKPKAEEKPCGYCGMDTTLSPSHITAVYTMKGKKPVMKDFDSLGCFMRVAMLIPPAGTYTDVKILDTSTFGSKEQKFVPIESAWFVPLESLAGSMPPYLASFASKKTATKYAKVHDSRVLNYEAAHKLVMKEISG